MADTSLKIQKMYLKGEKQGYDQWMWPCKKRKNFELMNSFEDNWDWAEWYGESSRRRGKHLSQSLLFLFEKELMRDVFDDLKWKSDQRVIKEWQKKLERRRWNHDKKMIQKGNDSHLVWEENSESPQSKDSNTPLDLQAEENHMLKCPGHNRLGYRLGQEFSKNIPRRNI